MNCAFSVVSRRCRRLVYCIHVSHSGHISEEGALLNNCTSLPLYNKLPSFSLNERCNYFICPPQTKYKWPLCPHFPTFSEVFRCMYMHTPTYFHTRLGIAASFQMHRGSRPLSVPEIIGMATIPSPPPPPRTESVWSDHKLCESSIVCTAQCDVPAIILTFDSTDILFCNLMWECGRFCYSAILLDRRHGAKYMSMSTRTV